jgi:hypothetical protein
MNHDPLLANDPELQKNRVFHIDSCREMHSEILEEHSRIKKILRVRGTARNEVQEFWELGGKSVFGIGKPLT